MFDTLKYYSTFIMLIGIINTSCSAQQKIATLSDNITTKAKLETYTIKKEQQKATIENSKNKLANVKQSSPNMPIGIALVPYYVKIDLKELTKICAKHISLNELESLTTSKHANIFIDMRTSIEAKVLEVSFFTDQNSILNLKQLESIENEIKTKNLITIKPEAERYIKGSNFLRINAIIYFDDVLKVKKTL